MNEAQIAFRNKPIVFSEVYSDPIAQKIDVLFDALVDEWCHSQGIKEDDLDGDKSFILDSLYSALKLFKKLEEEETV